MDGGGMASPMPGTTGPPLSPLRSTGRQPRIGRKGAAPSAAQVYSPGESIDMTSQGHRSISKTSATLAWAEPVTKVTAFMLTGQVSQCDTNSIRRSNAARYRANNYLTILSPRPPGEGAQGSYKSRPGSNQGFPITRRLVLRSTRNNGQPKLVPFSRMARIPKGSFSFDADLRGRSSGRRWRCVLPDQVSQAG